MTRGEAGQAGPPGGGWGWTQGPGSDVSGTDTWSSARGVGADSDSLPAEEDRPKRRPPAQGDGEQGGEGIAAADGTAGGDGPSSSELLTVLHGEGQGERRPGAGGEVKGARQGSGRKKGGRDRDSGRRNPGWLRSSGQWAVWAEGRRRRSVARGRVGGGTCGRQGYPGTASAGGVAAAPPAATGPGLATGCTSRGTSPRGCQRGRRRWGRRGRAPWRAGGRAARGAGPGLQAARSRSTTGPAPPAAREAT